MLKKSVVFVLITLITLSPVYSISLFPNKQSNIYSSFKINKVLYNEYTVQVYLESLTTKTIDGFQIIVKYENSQDTINIYNQLDPYSTKQYTFKVNQLNPKSLELRSITNNNHKLVFSSPITYTFNGNEPRIPEEQQPSITTLEQEQPQQLVNEPEYISYTSISKLDNEKNIIYFTKDHISSNRITTNNQRAIEYQANYQPYGNIFNEQGQEKFRFSGKELDSSNLYYFGARYYNSNIGRFTQVDPIYNPSISPYLYANNNPLKYVDPTGKDVKDIVLYPLRKLAYRISSESSGPYRSFHQAIGAVLVKDPYIEWHYDGTNYLPNGPNILKMFLKLEPITLKPSEFRPTSLTKYKDVPLFSIKEYLYLAPIRQRYEKGEYTWDTNLLNKILNMGQGDIISIPHKLSLIDSSINLAHFTASIGKDENGPYLSVFDVWGFDEGYNEIWGDRSTSFFEKIQPRLLEFIGEPIGFYDRLYLNENEIQSELTRR